MKNVLILEDHPTSALVVEEMFVSLVPGANTTVVGHLSQLMDVEPTLVDVVVSDLLLPDGEPHDVIDLVSLRFANSFRIFFTAMRDEKIERKIYESGGLLLSKSQHYKDLMIQLQGFLGLRSVNLEPANSRNEFQSLIQMPGMPKPLTIKQAQIMELVSMGRTGKEIAKMLAMSPDTVNSHIKDAFARLGVQNRGEAVSNYTIAKKLAARLHGEAALSHLQSTAG